MVDTNNGATSNRGPGDNSNELPPVSVLTNGIGSVIHSFAPKMAQARLTLAWSLQCIAALILFMAKHGGTVPAKASRKNKAAEDISAVVTLDHLTAIDTAVWTKENLKANSPAAKAKAALVGFVASSAEIESQTANKLVEFAARLHTLGYTVESDFNGHVSIDNGQPSLTEHELDARYGDKDVVANGPWTAPGFWKIKPEHVHPPVDNAAAVNPLLVVLKHGFDSNNVREITEVIAPVQRVILIDRFFIFESGQDGFKKRDSYRIGLNSFITATTALMVAKKAAAESEATEQAERARKATEQTDTPVTETPTPSDTAAQNVVVDSPVPVGDTPVAPDAPDTTPKDAASAPDAPAVTDTTPPPVVTDSNTPAPDAPKPNTTPDAPRTQTRTNNNVSDQRDPEPPPSIGDSLANIVANVIPQRLNTPALVAQAINAHLHLTKTLRTMGMVDYLKNPTDTEAKKAVNAAQRAVSKK